MLNVLKMYLEEIKDMTLNDTEHSNRTHLENFLNDIVEDFHKNHSKNNPIELKQEPPKDKDGGGAPDFVFSQSGLILGYVENKKVGANLESIAQSDQIKKYFTLSENIILTDYLHFCLLRKTNNKIEITKECRICELSELKSAYKNKNLDSQCEKIQELFHLFLSHNPKPINTALEFADSLALRTRYVRDFLVQTQISNTIDSKQTSSNLEINGLYNAFTDSLYKNLAFDDFCDSFAQTLTYSLFLAKLNNKESSKIDLYNVKKFIPKAFPLIKEISGFIAKIDELSELKWLIGEILTIINNIDTSAIITELNKLTQDSFGDKLHKDPYLHFYETFLSKYDPKLRELRGVYYTPQSVVDFIINAIDYSLKCDFGFENGLSEATKADSNITLLDFATGTGTFLLESFYKALEKTNKNTPKLESNIRNLIKNFYGFEFLIAPYAIAHLKLSSVLKEEYQYELDSNERLKIYLTNTLQNILQDSTRHLFLAPQLAIESKDAQSIKDSQILIITGNPPYNASSINAFNYEFGDVVKKRQNKIQTHYFYCGLDDKKHTISINERNPKNLQDDYVKFIRFAESKIESQEYGIVAIITNHGFIDNPTFRGMRWHLMNTFDKIYILNLHGNVKKKEISPNGNKDENVFDIQQGVSISIFVRTSKQGKPKEPLINEDKPPEINWSTFSNTPQCSVYHYDVYGKRKEKYEFLSKNTLDSINWQKLQPQNPFYLFIPQDTTYLAEYDKGWSVKDIFGISSTGIETQRDSVVIHKTKESIETLINDFCNMEKSEIIKKYNIQKDSRDWQIQKAIDSVKKSQANGNSVITQIHYRPFDYRWTYYNGESRAFISYPRDEVMQHFLQDSNNTDSRIENFTKEFRKFIDKKYGESFNPEEILGYIYAVLFHKNYREKYIDFLKIDFPKIPFVESKEKFKQLSKLGLELIATHLMLDEFSLSLSLLEAA